MRVFARFMFCLFRFWPAAAASLIRPMVWSSSVFVNFFFLALVINTQKNVVSCLCSNSETRRPCCILASKMAASAAAQPIQIRILAASTGATYPITLHPNELRYVLLRAPFFCGLICFELGLGEIDDMPGRTPTVRPNAALSPGKFGKGSADHSTAVDIPRYLLWIIPS